ncbi:MAG TPA: ferredoxin reductase [Pseudonocardia sp.]|uniref:ferredoxin reductase n=1 Tax=Pseudonocardia sp. TaxID=60912 RepID=UPI002CB99027|nr:ferredoxin reductase [Pseudonocardia sp.]HTF49548.1 ferredoxin reductase [Pseudonocardia sp.]
MFRVAPPRAPSRVRATVRAIGGALTTPLLPEDFAGLINPLWSRTALRGRVVEVRRETDRAATLRIRPGRGWRGHRAGQYVRLGVDVDGVRHWRTYSLTSPSSSAERSASGTSIGTDGCISVTVQALPGGVVSPHLVNATPAGTIVHLEPADGDFVLPDPMPSQLLMVTAGSGITPVMGMLRTLAARGDLADVVLLHSAPSAAEMIFRDELHSLADQHPGLRLVTRHTRGEGRLELAELDTACPDWRGREAYVCGPAGLLDAARTHWADAPDRLHVEQFTPPARTGGGCGGEVSYGEAATVDVDGESSLLEAGEAAGVLLPSGCRMGICFGCVLPLRDGQIRDLRTGEVHGEPGDLVQTCINGASGAARLDIPTT